jgi:hypothetical protein
MTMNVTPNVSPPPLGADKNSKAKPKPAPSVQDAIWPAPIRRTEPLPANGPLKQSPSAQTHPPLTVRERNLASANSYIFTLENMAGVPHAPPSTNESNASRRMEELWRLTKRKNEAATQA